MGIGCRVSCCAPGVLGRQWPAEPVSHSHHSRWRVGKVRREVGLPSYLDKVQQCFLELQPGEWAAGDGRGLRVLQG
jgi:hypothetical protein